MGTVIIDQFNPVHGYWNKLYEVDSADFDPDAPITIDKYGGPYRIRHIGEPDPVEDKQEEKVEVVFEEDKVEVVFEEGVEEEEIEEDPPKFDDSRW